MKYLKKFETENDRTSYENGESYIEPYVSYVNGGDVHYNKPPFFCKLTLSNGDVINIEGSGEISTSQVGPYKSSGITSADVGKLCTSIAEYAFGSCKDMTSITIADTVTSLGTNSFGNCSGLTSVVIPDSVTSIANSAFTSCVSLVNVTIPNSVTSIGNYTFQNCSGLTNVTIGSGVTSIGQYAFRNCSGLSNITSLATTAPTISSSTFYDVKTGGTLTVPQGSTGYDVWMQNKNYYLGKYNWTKVEQ